MKTVALALTLLAVLPAPFFASPQPTGEDVVLVTGFEPFGQWDSNPSGAIALALNGTTVDGARIVGVVLPVTFNTSYRRMHAAMERYDPAAVIALGLDGGARSMQVERVAVNLQHPSLWRLSPINVSGSLLRGSTLPAAAIVEALHDESVAARESWFAGLYVCNYVFYRLQGDAGRHDLPAGFIHVPPTPEQEPYGMELAAMQQGVRTAIDVTLAA